MAAAVLLGPPVVRGARPAPDAVDLEAPASHPFLDLLDAAFNGPTDKEGFYAAALWMHERHPKTLAGNIPALAEFGYLKDFPELLYRLVHGADVRKLAKEKANSKKAKLKANEARIARMAGRKRGREPAAAAATPMISDFVSAALSKSKSKTKRSSKPEGDAMEVDQKEAGASSSDAAAKKEIPMSKPSSATAAAMPAFKAPAPGFAVRCSPFHEHRLLAAASQHFGLVGNGHLLVLDLAAGGPGGAPAPVFSFPTSDALFDCAWSESHESLCAAASGDGSVRLFDAALPPAQNPVRLLREHAREVHGLDWNPVRRDAFVSASWDDTLKLWSPDRPASVRTFRGHEYCVYAAAWSARHPDVFASASGDRTARVWDVRDPAPTLVIPAHEHEVLSLDWDKYDPSILATASVDKSIRVWDVRAPRAPLAQLAGHGYAVKRVRFSPHRQGVLMSCSYDMTVCMWDYRAEDSLLARYAHHTEFVAGIDMSVLVEGLLASAGWDEMIYVWPFGSDPRAM